MLTEIKQLAGKIEAVEGVAEVLAATDAQLLVSDLERSNEVTLHERNAARRALTKWGSVSGFKAGGVNFTAEMAGPASAVVTDAPEWDKYIRACGWRRHTLKDMAIGAITTGPFVHGEVITQAISLASGIVIVETATGAAEVMLIDLETGTWDSIAAFGQITGGTSGATATPTEAPQSMGLLWRPWTFELLQLSIGAVTAGPFTAGEKVTGGTSGAIGYAYEATKNGDSIIRIKHATGTWQSAEVLTGAVSAATATSSSVATQSEIPSLTIRTFLDGTYYEIRGARGTVNLEVNAGEPMGLAFTFQGAKSAHGDVALFDPAENVTIPPLFEGLSVDIAGTTDLDINGLSAAFEATLAKHEAANYSGGIKSVSPTSRNWNGTLRIDRKQYGVEDFLTKLENNTKFLMDFSSIGSVASNRFRIYIPEAQLSDDQDGDRDGIATNELPFMMTSVLDDLEVVLMQY